MQSVQPIVSCAGLGTRLKEDLRSRCSRTNIGMSVNDSRCRNLDLRNLTLVVAGSCSQQQT